MPNEIEIERMVVRIVAETQQHDAAVLESAKKVEQAEQSIAGSIDKSSEAYKQHMKVVQESYDRAMQLKAQEMEETKRQQMERDRLWREQQDRERGTPEQMQQKMAALTASMGNLDPNSPAAKKYGAAKYPTAGGMSSDEEARLNARVAQLDAAEVVVGRRRKEAEKRQEEERFNTEQNALAREEKLRALAFDKQAKQDKVEYEKRRKQRDVTEKQTLGDAQKREKDSADWLALHDWDHAKKRQNRQEALRMKKGVDEKGQPIGGDELEWGYGMRAMSARRMANAAVQFGVAVTAEQEAAAAGHMLMAVGAMFGPVGMAISAALDVIFSKVDRVQAAANKGFVGMLDGLKTFEQGAAGVRFEHLKAEIDILIGKMNPTTMWGEAIKGTKRDWEILFGDSKSEQEWENKQVNKTVDDSLEAQARFTKMMDSQTGKDINKKVATAHVPVLAAEYRKAADTAGMLAHNVTAYQMALQGVSREEQVTIQRLGRYSLAMTELGGHYNTAWKQNRDFMLTAGEAAAREAEAAAGVPGTSSKEKRDQEILAEKSRNEDLIGQQNEMNKTARGYRDVIDGNSKASIAFYDTAEGGASRHNAYVKASMTDIISHIQSNTVKILGFHLTQGEALAQQLERDMRKVMNPAARTQAEEAVKAARAGDLKVQQQEMELIGKGWEGTAARKSKAELAGLAAVRGGQSQYNAFVKASMVEVEGQVGSGTRKVMDYMLTANEAANRQLRRDMADPRVTGPDRARAAGLIATNESNEKISQLQELSKAMTSYAMSMEFASKAQIAMAMAAEGGINKQLVYQQALLGEAAQATEQFMLPQDKYMKEQKRLNVLLKEGLISPQTFNRALGAAQSEIMAMSGPVQQAGQGGADAMGRIQAQMMRNRPVQQLMLDTGEKGLNEDVAQKTREAQKKIAEEIREELKKANLVKEKEKGEPKVSIKIGNLF